LVHNVDVEAQEIGKAWSSPIFIALEDSNFSKLG
jgi:hypothetical protein